MYDNDSYCDWHHSLQLISTAAAAQEISAAPAVGEVWRVLALSGYHDDPAAHDVYWALRQGATSCLMDSGTSLTTTTKLQFYDKVKCSNPIVLRYGENITLQASAPMAAGKKMYMHVWAEVLVGVTQ